LCWSDVRRQDGDTCTTAGSRRIQHGHHWHTTIGSPQKHTTSVITASTKHSRPDWQLEGANNYPARISTAQQLRSKPEPGTTTSNGKMDRQRIGQEQRDGNACAVWWSAYVRCRRCENDRGTTEHTSEPIRQHVMYAEQETRPRRYGTHNRPSILCALSHLWKETSDCNFSHTC